MLFIRDMKEISNGDKTHGVKMIKRFSVDHRTGRKVYGEVLETVSTIECDSGKVFRGEL